MKGLSDDLVYIFLCHASFFKYELKSNGLIKMTTKTSRRFSTFSHIKLKPCNDTVSELSMCVMCHLKLLIIKKSNICLISMYTPVSHIGLYCKTIVKTEIALQFF